MPSHNAEIIKFVYDNFPHHRFSDAYIFDLGVMSDEDILYKLERLSLALDRAVEGVDNPMNKIHYSEYDYLYLIIIRLRLYYLNLIDGLGDELEDEEDVLDYIVSDVREAMFGVFHDQERTKKIFGKMDLTDETDLIDSDFEIDLKELVGSVLGFLK